MRTYRTRYWDVPFRTDLSGSVEKTAKTPQGGLRVDAALTRAGVFEYMRADGSKVREYRPLDEVSRADSLASLAMAPVTNRHPPGKVTPANFRQYVVGHVGSDVRMDGDHVVATVLVQAADALADVATKRAREVSCGYTCELDYTPGVAPNGEKYDCVQRNIAYNHLAIVPQGRAGSSVCLRLDSAGDTVIESDTLQSQENEMTPDQIAKMQLDLANANAKLAQETARADAAEKLRTDAAAAQAKAEGERDAAKSRADAAEGALKLHADAAELARVTVIASKVVKSFKADAAGVAKSIAQVKAEIVAAKFPALKLDGKGDEYVDALVAAASEVRVDDAAALRTVARPVTAPREDSAETPREKMMRESRDAWKRPASPKASA